MDEKRKRSSCIIRERTVDVCLSTSMFLFVLDVNKKNASLPF